MDLIMSLRKSQLNTEVLTGLHNNAEKTIQLGNFQLDAFIKSWWDGFKNHRRDLGPVLISLEEWDPLMQRKHVYIIVSCKWS